MKNLIITVVLLLMLFILGCGSEDEMFELKSENLEVAEETENNQMAEITSESRPFVVFVCGEVNNPGVYELNENSRIIDAIMAAGGYTEKAYDNYVNLAEAIHDEQKIYIPSVEEVEKIINEGDAQSATANAELRGVIDNLSNGLADGAADASGKSKDGLVNINTASKEELMSLPGIGESKAEKIIAYREANGRFSAPEDIMQISGIKDGLYNKIKDGICAR